MPFTFQAYTSPLTASIAQTLQQQGAIEAQRAYATGNAAAQAAQQSGNAWAGAIQGIGQTIGALPGQIAAAKAADQQQAIRQQQLQQGAIQLTQAQREQSAQQAQASLLQGDQLPAGDAGPRQPSSLDENGLIDVPKVTAAYAAMGFGDKVPEIAHAAQLQNEAIGNYRTTQKQIANDKAVVAGTIAHGALTLMQAGLPVERALDQASHAATTGGVFSSADYATVKNQILALPPEAQPAALQNIRATAARLGKTTTDKEGDITYDMFGQVVSKGGEKPKTEAELAADAANPQSPTQKQSQQAMALLKPPPARTNEVDDQKYRDLTANAALGKPVSADDAAWARAYEKQKTLGVDASAGAAATRLASAQEQQNRIQTNAQTFSNIEKARTDISQNVDKPYATAQSGADTLRETVHAAQAGNKLAGSLQTLEATMGALRAQGFSRINTAEIGATGNAGNLWDNIAGYVGKKLDGQPVPADVQKDMLAFADILDQAAAKKYAASHDAVNKLYGTNIPRTYTVPSGAAAPGGVSAGAAPGATSAPARVRVIGPNGETGTVPAGSALPAGWRQQ